MLVEIITVGDELLIGQVIDTNSAWIAQELNKKGFIVKQITSVSDDRNHIVEALDLAQKRADIIILTGGLGPTKDDITKTTLCEFFKMKLILHQPTFENIKRLFTARGFDITELNRKQAEVPDGCTVLLNRLGTAPGMWFEKNDKVFISLPGVPFEMKALIKDLVLDKLSKRFDVGAIIHKTINTQGIGESFLAAKIESWEDALPEFINLAYLPAAGKVRLRLTAIGKDKVLLSKEIEEQIEKLKLIIPENITGFDSDSLPTIIGQLLNQKKATLGTAESCTGGYIAHLITEIPGSSSYFKGSIIAYANEVKENLLGVSTKDLIDHGAVSQEVVEQMAIGAKLILKTDYAIAISGIAGPDGGTKEKPVGTAWIAIATPTSTISKKVYLGEDRIANIERAATFAFVFLQAELNKQ